MEITEESIYWLTRLDHVKEFMNVVIPCAVLLALLSGCIFVLGNLVERADSKEYAPRPFNWLFGSLTTVAFICAVTAGIGNIFIPTTKEYAAIKVIPVIANNEDVQGAGKELVGLAREWMKELKPDGEKGGTDD